MSMLWSSEVCCDDAACDEKSCGVDISICVDFCGSDATCASDILKDLCLTNKTNDASY